MKRVFAEIEDEVANTWGFYCPRCWEYHSIEGVEELSMNCSCDDCKAKFLVTLENWKSPTIKKSAKAFSVVVT
ncbi:MAG: hypothetical protein EOP04_05185 [Proteobacteria bacterium]|nr:MAG: hypothetical protein EOP04_05185 [Pseudomonadota bacterium]